MLNFLHNYSIRRKLMGIMLITSTVVLLIVFVFLFVDRASSFRTMILKDQRILANIVGSNTTAAVTFDDPAAANETIERLSANPHILAAAIINSSNKLFALYLRKGIDSDAYGLKPITDGASRPIPDSVLLSLDLHQPPLWSRYASIRTVVPVMDDNQQISTIVIVSDTDELKTQLLRSSTLFAAVLAGALLLTYLISSKLQSIITEPVFHLAAAMKRVSSEKDYSIRSDFSAADEIGDLVKGFNEMLGQIELRDEQLRQYHLDLEEEVILRTSELTIAKKQLEQTVLDLEETSKVAESANVAKSQFLANMSHEIRTPMHGVLGMTELLLESNLSPEQQRFAGTVHDSAMAMLAIINDILDFSKIEAGKLELETAPFSLSTTVMNVVVLFSSVAQKKGLKLSCNLDPEVPDVLDGDVGRVRQILTNLINNAIKFTDQGEIFIAVKHEEVDDQHVNILIKVTDSGIGIPEDSQKRIFERFSQAYGNMNRKFGGTGLGLTIVRQLVEMMGGTIGVISKPGKGSTFWFTLKLARTAGQDTKSQNVSAERHDETPLPLVQTETCSSRESSINILVAEDNPVNQELIKTTLTMLGYRVELASNGLDAINTWAHGNYNIILMDGQMPVMDGFEATRLIREREVSESRPRVTIIAMTGQAMTGDRELFLAAGMDDYLPKPFSIKQIRELVNNWLPSETAQ